MTRLLHFYFNPIKNVLHFICPTLGLVKAHTCQVALLWQVLAINQSPHIHNPILWIKSRRADLESHYAFNTPQHDKSFHVTLGITVDVAIFNKNSGCEGFFGSCIDKASFFLCQITSAVLQLQPLVVHISKKLWRTLLISPHREWVNLYFTLQFWGAFP